MWERYPSTPPFHRGENELQASLISSASVGATPTPATSLRSKPSWERGCRAVAKRRRAFNLLGFGSASHFRIRSSISGATRCLREGSWRTATRVRTPSDPPLYRSVAQSLERTLRCANTLGPGGRRWKSCRSDHSQFAAVVEYIRHPPSKRNDAGGSPAGSANFKLPGGVKVARRFVKPHGVGASPTLAANFRV